MMFANLLSGYVRFNSVTDSSAQCCLHVVIHLQRSSERCPNSLADSLLGSYGLTLLLLLLIVEFCGRCLVVCKSMGIFATAHADGKMYLRALPVAEAGESPTVTLGEQPILTLPDGPAAVIQVWPPPQILLLQGNFHLTVYSASLLVHTAW